MNRPKILFVEDEQVIADLIPDYLPGFEIVHAATMKDAAAIESKEFFDNANKLTFHAGGIAENFDFIGKRITRKP